MRVMRFARFDHLQRHPCDLLRVYGTVLVQARRNAVGVTDRLHLEANEWRWAKDYCRRGANANIEFLDAVSENGRRPCCATVSYTFLFFFYFFCFFSVFVKTYVLVYDIMRARCPRDKYTECIDRCTLITFLKRD
jgi:hypothetical protein